MNAKVGLCDGEIYCSDRCLAFEFANVGMFDASGHFISRLSCIVSRNTGIYLDTHLFSRL